MKRRGIASPFFFLNSRLFCAQTGSIYANKKGSHYGCLVIQLGSNPGPHKGISSVLASFEAQSITLFEIIFWLNYQGHGQLYSFGSGMNLVIC